MTILQNMLSLLVLAMSTASLVSAEDLSRYREFQLDSGLDALAAQAGLTPAEATTVHERPALIQELSWRGELDDSVKGILFSFYNGELFRMVVDYDQYNTDGLTAKDMAEALSVTYGAADHPSAEITVPAVQGGEETVDVLARWEDAHWSFHLVQFKYETTFALVALSKRLHTQAVIAIHEAVERERLEAPQRERERQSRADEQKRIQQDEARVRNKPGFVP